MRASGSGSAASPAEDVSFDAAPDFVPGLESGRTSLDRGHPPFDLGGPLGFGIRIGGTVQAGEQFGGQFGPSVLVESQGIGQESGCGLGHDNRNCTPRQTAQQALAAGGAWRDSISSSRR